MDYTRRNWQTRRVGVGDGDGDGDRRSRNQENERNVRRGPFNTSQIVDRSEARGSVLLFSFPVAQSNHGEETMMRYSLFPSHVKEPNAKGGMSQAESGFQFLPPNLKLRRNLFLRREDD